MLINYLLSIIFQTFPYAWYFVLGLFRQMIMYMFGIESLDLKIKSLHTVNTPRGNLEKSITEEKGDFLYIW